MKPTAILVLGIFIAVLSGCASNAQQPEAQAPIKLSPSEPSSPTHDRLIRYYLAWNGVPHKLGGLNHQGIDCSGFVYVTYRDVFNKRVPRTTESLAEYGQPVSTNALQVGDLVFFKTGYKVRHVGIYTGGGQFIHASKSGGVMQSSLNDPYWVEHYWKARRVA